MTDKILSMDDYRPHLIIEGDSVHVVPIELVKKWISGEIEADKDCTRVIMKEWLDFIAPKESQNDDK